MSLEMTKLELQQAKDVLAEAKNMLAGARDTYQQVGTNIGAYGGGTGRSEHGEAVSGFQTAANEIEKIESAIIQAEKAIDDYVSAI